MNLVLVSSLVPVENPSTGFDIANRVVFDALRALGHRVSVIGYLQPGQAPVSGSDTHLLGELEVTNAKVGPATKLRWLATAILNHTTLSSAKMLKAGEARIEALLRALQPFDGLVLNSVQLPAAYIDVLQRYPSVYIAHNVEAASALENAAAASGLIERFLFEREAFHLGKSERRLTQGAGCVWTFSEADRFGSGKLVSQRSSVLPLVTQWACPAAAAPAPIQHDLGLIGTWSWKANRIGLDWFLAEVAPLLPPDMTIAIAGHLKDSPTLSHPGVRFVGRVADAHDFVRASAVVPLVARGGSGVQLKTIETFELGMPSVATRASLRGIDTLPENCAVADDPAIFAQRLIERVASVKAGNPGRISGSAFHAAQKSALLATMRQGLKNFESEEPLAIADPIRLSVGRQRTGSVSPVKFSMHEGGISR
ncbi:glycosyltransferase family 4 protein [Rhizobium sp. 32-5/1]|uniref:glycosyltransferase n=1 Tax=Rhizobium sp. 32-5/1 TaxID=3019602 RepID=UPI00240D5E98|nr:glycosyltransferase family 4 protein [Rhizobium sp. 32-5/1]WEZ84385.1 glycosyltransferase family 4 protein [Rhizobium sp. 32-5/1]